jgi:hypothetical protein
LPRGVGTKSKGTIEMNIYLKSVIFSLVLGLLGGIAFQFGYIPIACVFCFFTFVTLMCGPLIFEK